MSPWTNSGSKRFFDILCSLVGILFLSPLLLLISLVILLTDGAAPFYWQRRVGRGSREFHMVKFRSMYLGADRKGGPLTIGDDPRITPIGRLLRKYKMDELPQLFNVLRGDMSMVGPRPEVPQYVAFYNDEQRAVFGLKPGITDISSLLFRRESDLLAKFPDPEQSYISYIMPYKIRLTMEYARSANLWTDMALIFRTLRCLFKSHE